MSKSNHTIYSTKYLDNTNLRMTVGTFKMLTHNMIFEGLSSFLVIMRIKAIKQVEQTEAVIKQYLTGMRLYSLF